MISCSPDPIFLRLSMRAKQSLFVAEFPLDGGAWTIASEDYSRMEIFNKFRNIYVYQSLIHNFVKKNYSKSRRNRLKSKNGKHFHSHRPNVPNTLYSSIKLVFRIFKNVTGKVFLRAINRIRLQRRQSKPNTMYKWKNISETIKCIEICVFYAESCRCVFAW